MASGMLSFFGVGRMLSSPLQWRCVRRPVHRRDVSRKGDFDDCSCSSCRVRTGETSLPHCQNAIWLTKVSQPKKYRADLYERFFSHPRNSGPRLTKLPWSQVFCAGLSFGLSFKLLLVIRCINQSHTLLISQTIFLMEFLEISLTRLLDCSAGLRRAANGFTSTVTTLAKLTNVWKFSDQLQTCNH